MMPPLRSFTKAYGHCLLLFGFVLVARNNLWAAEVIEDVPADLSYNQVIRPILAENCFSCHGPDSAARKGDLRLDHRDAAIQGGAIVSGDPQASEMIRRLITDDPEERMPPPATKKTLSNEQRELLQRWITAGAPYQPHWSLLPPVRAPLPTVKNATWGTHPLDRFVLAKLESLGLSPAPPADRRTLARRVHLDLTGLAPPAEVVETFVNDPSPDAYEKYVDRLLNSDAWGEHRARYWLDAARYADTHGIHFDNFREIWSYRDWVIQAFNRNLPFDQFTIEQLAGDLLPESRLDQRIATGFNRCNITTSEGGAINEEYLVHYTRDRTETVGQVWMGMTVGCAVCHEHKFDPLSQREFYEMSAFFNNTTQAAMDGNIKDTPPVVPVPQPEDAARYRALQTEIPAVEQQANARRDQARDEFSQWLSLSSSQNLLDRVPQEALYLHAALNEGQGQSTRMMIDDAPRDVSLTSATTWQPGPVIGSSLQPQGAACQLADVADFERDQAWTCAMWIKLPANDSSGAVISRMKVADKYRGWDIWMQGRRIGTHIVSQWPENALKVVGREQVPANDWTHVTVTYDGSGKAAGVKVYYNGELQTNNVEADSLQDSIRNDSPFQIGQRDSADPVSGAQVQDLRIYRRSLASDDVMSLARTTQVMGILSKPVNERSAEDQQALYTWWLAAIDPQHQEITQRLTSLRREQADILARGTVAHVMNERPETPMAYVLFRGAYDQRRDPVTPNTPAMLPPMPDHLPRNRLGFAQWLLLPEHPLTSRVTVNQFWQQVFGTGLVRTAGDFGVAGEMPSNQELLDWLAVEFRESGWDVKRFFKMLVMSNTYQQSSRVTPATLERDPDNKYLSRGPRFRMDAEMVRDYALSASGLLVRRIGGPSVRPYQPPGVWEAVAMIGSNTRDYREDEGDRLYRRSMYTIWKRSAPPASMEIFNAPSREVCTMRRERTNTPLQALVTLNDPQFVESARALAQAALTSPASSASERITYLMERIVSRPPHAQELITLQDAVVDFMAYYYAHPEDANELVAVGRSVRDPNLDARELAAWTVFANQLLNLDEVLNK